MIVVRLREAMERYRRLTGHRMTYRRLAELTGVSASTLQAIAARKDYNTTLDTVDRIARALQCPIGLLLEQVEERSNLHTQQPSSDQLTNAATGGGHDGNQD